MLFHFAGTMLFHSLIFPMQLINFRTTECHGFCDSLTYFFSSSIQLFSWSLYTHIHMHLHYSKPLMSVEGVNLHKNIFYMLKLCSSSRRMRNQDAGSTLGFFGTQGAGFTVRTRWGKKHTAYIKILLWLQAHMLNLKLFSSWKKRRSRKIKTKPPSQTYSNLHIHTCSFSHKCSYFHLPQQAFT